MEHEAQSQQASIISAFLRFSYGKGANVNIKLCSYMDKITEFSSKIAFN